jgi:hypothetical protein
VAVSALVVVVARRTSPAIEGGADVGRANASIGATPVPLAAPGADVRRDDRAATGASDTADPPRPRRVRVRGRLTVPDGVDVTAGEVHVTLRDGDLARVAARARPATDGSFDVKDVEVDSTVSHVRAVATVPGFVTVAAEAAPPDDGDVVLDLDLAGALTKGRTIVGRVIDADGRPLSDLPVFVEASTSGSIVPVDRLDPSVVVESTEGPARGLRGTATTDRDGRFSIRGLQCGGCARARSGSRAWVILDGVVDSSGEEGRSLVAWPAVELDLAAVDAASGRSIGAFAIDAVGESGAPWSTSSASGRVRVLWPRSPRAGASLDLTATADGYAPTSEVLRPRDRESRVTAVVSLEPVAARPNGRLVIRVEGDDPASFGVATLDADFRLTLCEAGRGSAAVRRDADAETEVADVPSGTWSYELVPRTYGPALAQTGTVTVPPAAVGEIVWRPMPPNGAIRLPPFDEAGRLRAWIVLRDRHGDRSLRLPFEEFLACPTGTWTVTVEDLGGATLATYDAQVREGEVTTVGR